ncbi:MAG: GGDEF domain-containing protein [Planctomycetota bacterium]|jgi:diguanylate cyclase (GGDEF)-like protein
MPDFNKDEFLTTKAEIDALLGTESPKSQNRNLPEKMKTPDLSPNTNAQKVLLAGDISRAFLDADTVRKMPCQVHSDIIDAIDAAAEKSFAVIGVVMAGAPAKLGSVLKYLREVSRDAKIILLAQMYEEPIAIKLVGGGSNGESLADDYLICPVDFSSLVSPLQPVEQGVSVPTRQRTKAAMPVTVDTAMEMKIRHLEKLATTDELTGLKNRRYIWEFSRQIMERAKEENGRVTLLIFDIDDFKHYNDVYGHSAGDEVLRQAAVLMQRSCREHDVVGRIGGDEFAVIFWDEPQLSAAGQQSERRSTSAEHPKEAIFIAKRFRRELGKAELHLLGDQGKGVLTISGGLASFPRDGLSIQQLFQQADKALLEAKRSGKNRIYLVGKPTSDIADIE